ncbi:MAG: hypothetical protein GXO66_05130 [Euryarchaeota archaeon]|nr:hypothetical protein [Euryarchaeota archaeon]
MAERCTYAFAALAGVAAVLAYLAPEEEFLGASYKLLYLHLPLLYISLGSLYLAALLGVFSARGEKYRGTSFKLAVTALPFALANLVVIYFFERITWGAFVATEPRFYYLLLSYGSLLLLLLLHRLGERRLLAWGSGLLLTANLLLYLRLRSLEAWQLHPGGVGIPLEMRLPLVFSLGAFLCLHYLIFKKLEG